MRTSGKLTDSDKRKLMHIHENCLRMAEIVARRIVRGSDEDNHPNSWWRHFDKEIECQSKNISMYSNAFLGETT